MNAVESLTSDLHQYSRPERIEACAHFFKAFPGGYGGEDTFLGISVPDQRKVAKAYYKQITLDELAELLCQPIHEYRLTALMTLVYQFQKSKTEAERTAIADFYLKHLDWVNNWDLVDASAPYILGPYFLDKNTQVLDDLVSTNDLWKQRVAVLATFAFIRVGKYELTLRFAEKLLTHKHDLIHKAVGWMLREIGNRNSQVEHNFLELHSQQMPRTMLRYSIEKFPEETRQYFMRRR